MKLKKMTIEQIINECNKHSGNGCRHCPFCKDIFEIQDDETGAKGVEVECSISNIWDKSDKELEEEFDL